MNVNNSWATPTIFLRTRLKGQGCNPTCRAYTPGRTTSADGSVDYTVFYYMLSALHAAAAIDSRVQAAMALLAGAVAVADPAAVLALSGQAAAPAHCMHEGVGEGVGEDVGVLPAGAVCGVEDAAERKVFRNAAITRYGSNGR